MTERKVKMWGVGLTTINKTLDTEKYESNTVNEENRLGGDEVDSGEEAIEKIENQYPRGDWEIDRIRYVKKVFKE